MTQNTTRPWPPSESKFVIDDPATLVDVSRRATKKATARHNHHYVALAANIALGAVFERYLAGRAVEG